ncbi:MAG: phosphopantothenoylcysteine decarboxylase [Comamonadaceae bacterium]|nr:phosphopantothenoylcysteine decarboxylase [Comamonadaceae bacterium]
MDAVHARARGRPTSSSRPRRCRTTGRCRSRPRRSRRPADALTLELVAHHRTSSRRSRPARRAPFVVGFAAETQNVERNALAKLEGKRLDLIARQPGGRRPRASTATTTRSPCWPGGMRELARAPKLPSRRDWWP